MKTNLSTVLGSAACALALSLPSAWAGFNFNPAEIPDGNSVGVTSVIHVSGEDPILSAGNNVSVILDVSGGYNGDLYASLSYNGTTVVLLNRPGVTGGNALGFTEGGLLVTLRDGSIGIAGNINTYGNSSYMVDGGQVSGDYNAAGGATTFQTFNGKSANGDWTLFFADLSGGDHGNTSILNGWGLNLTTGPLEVNPVPEPVNMALAILGVVVVGLGVVRRLRRSSGATADQPTA